ncbi:homogentisate solanesyltransferase, chloroplastic-like [Morus notabilis]|uniref:homogentisate solanesyltransferase, chloroplastic-like n=1 Tax=Morus notabilis TaxID=981085 RepID=UPI000CED552F|nr:homogentisate solanesyltransferase, chloroplastic-like [Morus notabilis]XP_024016983.1 homogentisate solanesyltransferase, chloroplastic-like [Morus notabilis]XP_024016984.1 homogentisate solanesyltransferase, chloroplastic-like [Morus notabilis]XP_024016985.1 homogentisate solanesyltransferase, chloroplastic-like [Morus notabilis]
MRLHRKSSMSSETLYGQHKFNSVQTRAQVESAGSDSVLVQIYRCGSAFKKFQRPYAILPATISVICLFARVLLENPQLFKWSLLIKAVPCLIAILLAYAYCVCINDIYDADIDRINKPYLPIPAGEVSLKQAWLFAIFDEFFGLMIFWLMNADRIITSLYCLTLFIGTIYSAPPVRFKRSCVATIILLALTWGVLHNVGIIYAATTSLGLQFGGAPQLSLSLSLGHCFMWSLTLRKISRTSKET